jgi:hypothetical protein
MILLQQQTEEEEEKIVRIKISSSTISDYVPTYQVFSQNLQSN